MAWKMRKPEEVKEVKEEFEEVKEPTKSEKIEKHRWVVVKELPVQPVRDMKDKDGTIVHFITTEEALTTIMNED